MSSRPSKYVPTFLKGVHLLVFFLFFSGIFASNLDTVLGKKTNREKDSLQYLAKCHFVDRNFKEAVPYYEELLRNHLTNNLEKDTSYYELVYQSAYSYYYTGQYAKAITFFRESLKFYERTNAERKIVQNNLHLAGALTFNSQQKLALPYYKKVLDLCKDKPQYSAEKADVYFYMADIYKFDKRLTEAFTCINKAIDIYTKLDDQKMLSDALQRKASCHYYSKNYKEAIVYYKLANKQFKSLEENDLVFSLNGIALCFEKLGVQDSARYYHEASRENATQTGNKCYVMYSYANFGNFYAENDSLDKAKTEFGIALQYADSLKDPRISSLSYLGLSKTYEKTENYKQALQYYKNFHNLGDSLQKNKSKQEYAKLEVNFKTLEKEREIDLLENTNRIKSNKLEQQQYKQTVYLVLFILITSFISLLLYIKFRARKKTILAEQKIQFHQELVTAEQEERKRISQDLHDSLGQMISLIKLKTSNVTPLPEDKNQMDNLLGLIDTTYEELRKISYNIMPETLTKEGIVSAIDELASDITNKTAIKVAMNSQVGDDEISEFQSIALFRIVQEIVSNTLKHAGANLISISIDRIKEQIRISIKDNGKGFNPKLLTGSKGMGWKNINSRISMISGTIDVQSSGGEGTAISISF